MPRTLSPRIPDADVARMAAEIAAGHTLADVARRNGVIAEVLSRRIRGAGLACPVSRQGPGLSLVYRATCPSCGTRVMARQAGLEADDAWQEWCRLACSHFRRRHGVTGDDALRWAHVLWDEWGEREVLNLDGHAV